MKLTGRQSSVILRAMNRTHSRHLCLIAAASCSWPAVAFLNQSPASAQVPPGRGYQITTLGLTGSGYEYVDSGGTRRNSFLVSMNEHGRAIGASNPYSVAGVDLGQDAWLFNGSSTQKIGLMGSGYEYAASGGSYRNASAELLNDLDQVIGRTERYGPTGVRLGSDAWRFDGTDTHLIGLTGSGYEFTAHGGIHVSSSPISSMKQDR